MKKIAKLEILRGAASFYVFAGHVWVGDASDKSGIITFFLRFGQEAVMCFFLLSGFVIYYSHHLHYDHSFPTYLRRRSRRICPIFILALGLSYLVVALGGRTHFDGREFAGNLFLLQDFSLGKPGVWFDTFCGNVPLWSLSYEWWFYMMFFPIYSNVPERYQLPLVELISLAGLLSYAGHPNQISLFLLYFILWWAGVEVARTYCRGVKPTFYTQRRSLFSLASFCILLPLVFLGFMPHPQHFSIGLHPALEIQHFVACFGLLCAGLGWSYFRWKGFSRILGVFSRFAPISYALYVFHYPLTVQTEYLDRFINPHLRAVLAVGMALLIAYLAEVPFQRAIVRLTQQRKPGGHLG